MLMKKTNQPGWIATKVDEQGNVLMDSNGHINEWIIDDTTFKNKYEIDSENPNLCKPKGGLQVFVQIPDNIILNQWGSDMQIAAGDILILLMLMICMEFLKEILKILINLLMNYQ